MHDLLFAKDIFEQVIKVAEERNAKKIKSITIEIGEIDHHHAKRGQNRAQRDHGQLLQPSHLEFHLKNLFKDSDYKKVKINFKKTKGNRVVLREMEV